MLRVLSHQLSMTHIFKVIKAGKVVRVLRVIRVVRVVRVVMVVRVVSRHSTVLYLEASVLLQAQTNSVNPEGPISVKTL